MIEWNFDPVLFQLGPITVRWYGLIFATGFLAGLQFGRSIFKSEGVAEEKLDQLMLYLLFGTIIGARLGHVIFYDPGYYLSNPVEILKTWHGGLASHGGVIGILLGIYLYSRKSDNPGFLWAVDRVSVVFPFAAGCIRLGNLANSEIIGKPTDLPWAFKFLRVDNIPRHPAQLYEALGYFSIFIFLWLMYKAKGDKLRPGTFLGLVSLLVGGHRFLIEFFKENQSAFEDGMLINMGQLLSIPLVLLGLFMLFRPAKAEVKVPKNAVAKKNKNKKGKKK